MSIKPIEINSKVIHLMKPVTGALYDSKTVLTKSSWEFVELWLRRQSDPRAKEALIFWGQSHNFYNASECLPIESRPLTAYYCCLNATKALLAIKGPVGLSLDNIYHGISSKDPNWISNNIEDANVRFQGQGVLYELSKYLSESASPQRYKVLDLLYNIPCIHRAFSITYKFPELFIPIRDVNFVVDNGLKKGWVQFQIDERYANGNSLHYVPSSFEKVTNNGAPGYFMRAKETFDWDIHGNSRVRHDALSIYHSLVRKDLHYIFGDSRLWYLKKDITTNTHILKRNSLTLIFAVMHWLSELVRYNPAKFERMKKTKQYWVINEFVNLALDQFIDEISCEITQVDIMTNGYRK